MDGPEGLFAAPVADLLPVRDGRAPVRVLVAALAPGGAERIVIDWLEAEAALGREVELAVLHARRTALTPPPGVRMRVRGPETPAAFLANLARDWRRGAAPVSTHLVTDEHLAILWDAGVRTVPVVHNARAGWRNDPSAWPADSVPGAVACARAVREEMQAAGCRVPVTALRHRPRLGAAATDPAARAAIRASLGVADGTLLVLAVGAFKPQKDHARAVEVLAALAKRRDAVLVILGGILDAVGRSELGRVLDAAVRLGITDRLRLPGFVSPIEPWLAAGDALLNVSRYEGLSIATQEALAASLPVVAADVGGQGEIGHDGLALLPARSGVSEFADRLAALPVRRDLVARPFARAPRLWSLTLTAREAEGPALETLFVTANLNAGGAQRSLANLATALAARIRIALAVCGETTHGAFAGHLRSAGVEIFRASESRDDFAIAESLLAHAARRRVRTLCFWNAAPGVKLLVARMAPATLRLVDVSPGRYAFEELDAAVTLAEAIDFTPGDYHARLDLLVLKHDDPRPPACRRVERIPNGVAMRAAVPRPGNPRFLVAGRIAPSKRLETILAAFAVARGTLPGAELHFFGNAEPRHAAYARALLADPGEGVHFRGPDFDLGYLAEPWTAAVVLGTHQGCPNAVLEAFSAGVPVIANASGGTGEIVEDGETGWLLAEDCTAGDLARALLECVGDPAEIERRGAAGRERVRTCHSLDAMAVRYLSILAGGNDAPPPSPEPTDVRSDLRPA
ncbi:MAG: glycosyltransferase [Betaproteobacteria bacterium]|nr:glycosyltransferase [Betaproteobacteria bacterium]